MIRRDHARVTAYAKARRDQRNATLTRASLTRASFLVTAMAGLLAVSAPAHAQLPIADELYGAGRPEPLVRFEALQTRIDCPSYEIRFYHDASRIWDGRDGVWSLGFGGEATRTPWWSGGKPYPQNDDVNRVRLRILNEWVEHARRVLPTVAEDERRSSSDSLKLCEARIAIRDAQGSMDYTVRTEGPEGERAEFLRRFHGLWLVMPDARSVDYAPRFTVPFLAVDSARILIQKRVGGGGCGSFALVVVVHDDGRAQFAWAKGRVPPPGDFTRFEQQLDLAVVRLVLRSLAESNGVLRSSALFATGNTSTHIALKTHRGLMWLKDGGVSGDLRPMLKLVDDLQTRFARAVGEQVFCSKTGTSDIKGSDSQRGK